MSPHAGKAHSRTGAEGTEVTGAEETEATGAEETETTGAEDTEGTEFTGGTEKQRKNGEVR